ncbi:ribosome hibernation-promoting factor, HPF/YfiA family [Sulfurimonas paralvinellae]|uniref:Ribosome hibernation promoting factor n=1 Tax=Sulfurimonas paralvinellae TaxID=317658 RepID=A0A7M1B9P3_9BACT|nr:ribosome-associated translation inhibitor RaiA [Sulfurimonas paralvinellae]QOP46351.1 ribosome-associated translation inhibitor RaiA [Sulfurimonas paralvinellae]
MNISLTGRNLELTDAIKQHMTASIEALKKYNMDIISANVIATTATRKGKEHFNIEFVLNLPQKNTIVINQHDSDLYAAIDIALERAEKALRRLHDKEVDHHKVGLNELKAEIVDVKEVAEEMEDEIIPVELDLYKPREVEDVLSDLKESGKMFEIFVDNEHKTRVLYKRNDGKFGLY